MQKGAFKGVLSLLALIGMLILLYVDLNNHDSDLTPWVYGLLGSIVLQAEPSDLLEAIKSFFTKK